MGKLYARLIRKCAVVEDLFYSMRNITAAGGEMCQFWLIAVVGVIVWRNLHHVRKEEKMESSEWIDLVDEQIFNLTNAEDDWICLQLNKSHSSRESSVKRQ